MRFHILLLLGLLGLSACATLKPGSDVASDSGTQADTGQPMDSGSPMDGGSASDCGDGEVGFGEVCDDGNNIEEGSCPYGQATCTLCNPGCSAELQLTGSYCGDGVVDMDDNEEVCDDGNVHVCGLCSADCQVASTLARATGVITVVPGNELSDGDLLILDDGQDPVTFEFDFNNSVPIGHSALTVSTSSSGIDVADEIAIEVNAIHMGDLDLDITAMRNGTTVELTHGRFGTGGNAPIEEIVRDSDFTVMGLAGGVGRDCEAGIGCSSGDDCFSGTCLGGVCQDMM